MRGARKAATAATGWAAQPAHVLEKALANLGAYSSRPLILIRRARRLLKGCSILKRSVCLGTQAVSSWELPPQRPGAHHPFIDEWPCGCRSPHCSVHWSALDAGIPHAFPTYRTLVFLKSSGVKDSSSTRPRTLAHFSHCARRTWRRSAPGALYACTTTSGDPRT